MSRAIIREDQLDLEIKRIQENLPPDKVVDPEQLRTGFMALFQHRKSRARKPKIPAPPGGITIMEASRKYKIANPTLSRWAKRGLIPVLLETRNEKYLDEHFVKEIVEMYLLSPGRGKHTVDIRRLATSAS